MKYSVIMPYYDRLAQLERTLISFGHHYHSRDDYEIIVVEDKKNTDGLNELLARFIHLPLRWFRMGICEENHTPSKHYNEGAKIAHGQYLILTNPECLHLTDILGGCDRILAGEPEYVYIVCACRHVTRCSMGPSGFDSLSYREGSWYQHSRLRNKQLNFCSIIPAAFYRAIGGFDEEFGPGYAYADDDFRDRVKANATRLFVNDDLVVLHQEHRKFHSYVSGAEYRYRIDRNRQLYESKKVARGALV